MTTRKSNTFIDTKTRVAVYARFSCDKQRDESIEDQVNEAQKYCIEHGYVIVNVYPDYAISGRSDERPQFLQMIEDAKKGMFDTVLVWKMDRFARNMQDQYYYEKLINDAGVRLESVKEHIAGNSIEASMSKGMLAIFAQIRSQQSAEDTMRGMLGKARKCQYLGVHWFGYSHDGDEITLDPVNAPIAREIHVRYLRGESQKDIVQWLNGIGVRGTTGKPVGNTFVTGILKHMVYAGVYMWGKQKDERGNVVLGPDGKPVPLVRVEDGVPAIVTMEEKERCLWRLTYRKHANAKADYLLSGKLFCGDCALPMHGETCKNHDGVQFFRYCCQGKRKACSGIYWKDRTEEAVAKAIRATLARAEVRERIASGFMEYRAGQKPEASIEAAMADLKAIGKQRQNLIKAVEDGMPYKHVQEKMEKLDAQEAEAERKLARLEKSVCEITKADALQFLELLADGMLSTDELLKGFVSSVWAKGDILLAVLNFAGKDSTPYEIEGVLSELGEMAGQKQVRVTSSKGGADPKKELEPAGQSLVRELDSWLPRDDMETNHPKRIITGAHSSKIILLENGFGIVVSLNAA
ncbi:MAG: recombinase family protein [Eggerthellaceae bacterium]|nr:recombinase family protein [Eggerthellaceae bacterium]